MKELLKKFWKEEEGVTMMEYALIGALISIIGIAAMKTTSGGVLKFWNDVAAAF